MNAPMANTAAADIREVEAFLYMEARLADENRYDDWAALWTEDALYWLPANIDDYDPNFHISIIYDDRSRTQDRIDRLKSGGAWAQEPRSRMRRIRRAGTSRRNRTSCWASCAAGCRPPTSPARCTGCGVWTACCAWPTRRSC